MGEAFITRKGGTASNVDDLIKEYTVSADGDISAGDLCEFINGQVRKTTSNYVIAIPTEINNSNSSYIHSVSLDINKILVCYRDAVYGYAYAVILTINGTIITQGNHSILTGFDVSNMIISKLNSGKACLTYRASSSGYIFALILNVSGSTITTGSYYSVFGINSLSVTAITVDETHVLVSYAHNGQGNRLYHILMTISGDAITVGTPYPSNSTDAVGYISSTLLTTNTVFVCFRNGTNGGYLYGVVLTINLSNGFPTHGDYTQIVTADINYTSTATIDSTRILVSFSIPSPNYARAMVVSISNYTITTNTWLQVNSVATGSKSIVQIDATRFLLSYWASSTVYVYSVILTVSGTSIAIGPILQIDNCSGNTNYPVTSCFLDTNKYIVAYTASNLNGKACCLFINDNNVSKTFLGTVLNPQVLALASASIGNTVKCLIKGIAKGLSGLIPNNTYYCDNGDLTTTVTSNKIGVALSDTELLIKKAWWER